MWGQLIWPDRGELDRECQEAVKALGSIDKHLACWSFFLAQGVCWEVVPGKARVCQGVANLGRACWIHQEVRQHCSGAMARIVNGDMTDMCFTTLPRMFCVSQTVNVFTAVE